MTGMRDDWKQQIRAGVARVEDLVRRGLLGISEAAALRAVEERFQLAVSAYYLELVDWNDPHCPIRRQAIPDPRELVALPTELEDPVGDRTHRRPPVLVHRYPDRVLLFPTLRCPMFCRYCFRKVYLNEEDPVRLQHDLEQALGYIRAHEEIHEVILSGGDPLLVGDSHLEDLLRRLRGLEHIRRLRIHSRVPATLPMRITPALVELLRTAGPLTLVAHYNHPRELTAQASEALARLRDGGIPLANQSVLLAGVNDDVDTLRELFEGLLDRGARPYYLHHPDVTVGTQHFRVSLERGRALYRALRGRASGLAIPQYVIEIPGGLGKVPADGAQVAPTSTPGIWRMESPFGGVYTYVDPAVWPTGEPGTMLE